jgi:protein arginine N-methyltransferase 3
MVPQQAGGSSSSETSELREEEGWEDAEPDNEELSFVSFFDDKTFPDAISMLEYSREKYNFDFISVQKEHGSFVAFIACLSPCTLSNQI